MSKFIKGFAYAFKGISHTFKTQINFRFHCAAAILALLLGWYVKLNQTEWLWILAAIALVMILELLNTAIEAFVDLVSPSLHPKAGQAKDSAAAAVLLAAIFAAAVGMIIFIPKLF